MGPVYGAVGMKRTTSGEYDTELILDEKSNVLVGSVFFNSDQIKEDDKAWEFEMIQKLSREMPFMPEILDYHFKGTSIEYALPNIGQMYPLEFYCQDLCTDYKPENIIEMFVISNNILHMWRGILNEWSVRNNVIIHSGNFWDGAILDDKKNMLYLNFTDFSLKKKDQYDFYLRNNNNQDIENANRFLYTLVGKKQRNDEVEEKIKKNDTDLKVFRAKYETLLKKKNEQLSKSISKESIKATLGEMMYKFYFGDSDG